MTYLLFVSYQKLIFGSHLENNAALGYNLDIHLVFQNSFHQSHQENSFQNACQVWMVQHRWQCSLHLACTGSHTLWRMRVCAVLGVIADLFACSLCSPACSCHLCWSRHHHISGILREHWHIPGSWRRSDWMTCW